MSFKDVVELFVCPLSKQLMREPIWLVADEKFYESDELDYWFDQNGFKSPKTNENISCKTIKFVKINSLLSDLIEKFPDLEKVRYVKTREIIKQFQTYKNEVFEIIEKSDWNSLTKYKNYSLVNLGFNKIRSIILSKKVDVIKYVIDNCVDLDSPITISSILFRKTTWKLINLVAHSSDSAELITHLVSLGADVDNQCDNDLFTPLHQSIHNQNWNVVKCLVDNGANLNSVTSRDTPCFALLCEYGPNDLIKYCYDKAKTNNILHHFELNHMIHRINLNTTIRSDEKDGLINMFKNDAVSEINGEKN